MKQKLVLKKHRRNTLANKHYSRGNHTRREQMTPQLPSINKKVIKPLRQPYVAPFAPGRKGGRGGRWMGGARSRIGGGATRDLRRDRTARERRGDRTGLVLIGRGRRLRGRDGEGRGRGRDGIAFTQEKFVWLVRSWEPANLRTRHHSPSTLVTRYRGRARVLSRSPAWYTSTPGEIAEGGTRP